ncbi:ribosomal-protein-alanine acetyltransferase [[Clostridium] sordellii]|uniref:Acetyltransferase n=1 Tax=Paraclostridium sordellii TaxID=1505 RepID=A0ABP1XVC3_PARSO|nr:GNAT family N-acetyltransferase [Paeniclostridium sordellii]EPZ57312.1 acetyltransferase family protein [[Clostridium] sordellii ATCC 9714] [Paeniclostridium sordellii ATCC 9714]CEJ73537.1 acetyltransferase [[Clostridium] sordellii] [Paeniclostridium sordellii]CEN69087.1 ribosomal-protein-alanine acetyltransferase [[Clostridium] sordellii] [Paeniclostridium sordellii]CEN72355.1 ribosomal-protein-alanine acetyltransferase [[Clostridium] sordellii] [Paeniclostridium sordellii]CEO23712.1 ribos
MYRIVDISCSLRNDLTLEILKESVFKPTKEKLIKSANYYESKEGIVSYGYICDDMILGLIVLDKTSNDEMIILDIAVRKDKQKLGIGSELLNYVIYGLKPRILVAETDDDAVGFYEKKQFEIVNLGEKHSNINRYECRYFNLYND